VVTAGTSSPLTDGAAAVLVTRDDFAERHGLQALARIRSFATVGVDPAIMGIGPIPATRKALARAGLTVADLDVVEINEAFSSQALACIRDLGLDMATVNIDGGGLAIGHPLAPLVRASRARQLPCLHDSRDDMPWPPNASAVGKVLLRCWRDRELISTETKTSTPLKETMMLRSTETLDSLFERQRGTLPDAFGARPLALAEGRMTMELTIAPWMMAPNGFHMPPHR
jgi:hypothetical protein